MFRSHSIRLARMLCAAILSTVALSTAAGATAAPSQAPSPRLQGSPGVAPEPANGMSLRFPAAQTITETLTTGSTIYLPVMAYPLQGFFVAANGSARGDGTRGKPWDLKTALANPAAVRPGTTIWLRGGNYQGVSSKLKGTPQAPVIVRQYPGERAIVDGTIMAYGEYTWFWGFEITNSQPRKLPEAEHARRGPGLGLYGPGHKAINLIIYNAGHPAISFGEKVPGGEINGCVIWGTGLYQDEWIRGSAIYGQNLSGEKIIRDVISFRNFTTGMKTWSQAGGHGNGFRFEGVISFDNGDRNIFAGSSTYPLNQLTLVDSATYRSPGDPRIGVQLGYESNLNNENLQVGGNTFVNGNRVPDLGALAISFWASGEIRDNILVSRKMAAAYSEPDAGTGKPTWRNNQFFSPSNSFGYGHQNGSYETLSFAAWGGRLGLDGSNTYTPQLPTGVQVIVRANQYEKGRGHMAIFNWDQRDEVEVDLSSLLSAGQAFWIYDAQNLLADPVAQGVYQGQPVRVPLNLTEVAPITGEAIPFDNVHTPVEFGAYLVVVERLW